MAGPNPFFDNFNNTDEQFLHDGLIKESIEIFGQGMYYIPRRLYDEDHIYTEDVQSFFDTVYLTTFYIRNVDGFEGAGNFMSKFGLEIRDQVTLVVSDTIFRDDVAKFEDIQRPREGDLIFYPLNKKVFEITFVEKFDMYFPFGATPSYTITCSLYEYSGQEFRTGIPDIDSTQKLLSENLLDWSVLMEDGSPTMTEDNDYMVVEMYDPDVIEPEDEGPALQHEADEWLNFTEHDPFSDGPY